MINPKNKWRRYNTPLGICINEKCETVILSIWSLIIEDRYS